MTESCLLQVYTLTSGMEISNLGKVEGLKARPVRSRTKSGPLTTYRRIH